MIKDKLNNAYTYYSLSENIKLSFEWLKNNNLDTLNDGKYEISENIYANVQTYETKDEALFEAHKKYIDIQYMIKGKENVGIANLSDCLCVEKYGIERDLEFLSTKKSDTLTLNEGEFLIFYPQDAHQPSLKIRQNEIVKKVVIKVHI